MRGEYQFPHSRGVINESGHIYEVPPRRAAATQQIIAPSAPVVENARIEIDGWVIQVMGDAVVVTCAGEVMTQTRTGRLNQKETIIRRDPPQPASSRGTEIIGKRGSGYSGE